jgi:hypothetical protein
MAGRKRRKYTRREKSRWNRARWASGVRWPMGDPGGDSPDPVRAYQKLLKAQERGLLLPPPRFREGSDDR